MAGEKSLYCVAKGDYVAASLATEGWQMGVRLWADTSVPDDVGNLPTTGSFGTDDHSGSNADGSAHTNWKWDSGVSAVIDPVSYMVDNAAPAWKTFITAATLSSNVRLKTVTLYPITDTGHVFEARSCVYTFTTPPVGASSSSMLPPEVSSCVSWKTGRVGRHGRGRIYVPGLTTTATDANGFLTSSWVTNLVSRGLTLATDLAVDGTLPTDTHVRPIVTGAPWTTYGVITSVNVGTVADAQRRRRRQLVEARTSLAVTY